MEKVTLREYAKRYKISFFNVMKMVRNGKVRSTLEENITYIIIEEESEKETSEMIESENSKSLSLEEENKLLKQEVKMLKKALERCNKRTVLV